MEASAFSSFKILLLSLSLLPEGFAGLVISPCNFILIVSGAGVIVSIHMNQTIHPLTVVMLLMIAKLVTEPIVVLWKTVCALVSTGGYI